jgi:hypothetical protein
MRLFWCALISMTLFNVSAGTALEVPADGSIHEYMVTGDFAGTPNGVAPIFAYYTGGAVIGPPADHFQGPFSSYRIDVNVNGFSLGTCDYNIPAGGCARYDRRPSFGATYVFESDPYIRAWGALFASGPDVGPSTLRIFLEPSEGFFITAIPEPST